MATIVPAVNSSFIVTPDNGTSMAASIVGAWVRINQHQAITGQFAWTGTPTGTLTADVSNDIDPNVAVVMGAFAVTLTGATNPAGSTTGSGWGFLAPAGWAWLRLGYTRTGGTGAFFTSVSGKQI